MNIVAIIQARCGSSRFPNKVFADINGKPLIWHVVNRLKHSKKISEILLATTSNSLDDKLNEWSVNNSVSCFRGSENDVLNRFYEGAKESSADIIVRVTADDPFKEPDLIDKAIDELIDKGLDFVSNNNPPTYPEGIDVEVMTFAALEKSEKESNSDFEREHVTQYIYRHPELFKISNISNETDLSYLRWTIDTEKDLEMTKIIYDNLDNKDDSIFHMGDILALLQNNPEIAKINSQIPRSAMYKKITHEKNK